MGAGEVGGGSAGGQATCPVSHSKYIELELKHMFLLAEFMFLLELLKIMKICFLKKRNVCF